VQLVFDDSGLSVSQRSSNWLKEDSNFVFCVNVFELSFFQYIMLFKVRLNTQIKIWCVYMLGQSPSIPPLGTKLSVIFFFLSSCSPEAEGYMRAEDECLAINNSQFSNDCFSGITWSVSVNYSREAQWQMGCRCYHFVDYSKILPWWDHWLETIKRNG
jgi:hypothetical protein